MNNGQAVYDGPLSRLVILALLVAFTTKSLAEERRPRVFITDSQSWEVVGSAAGSGGNFASRTQGGARPQTAEIIKTFGERCEQVIVNNMQEKADYVVVLDHEGGKGVLLRRNKIAVFNKEGDAIVSRSTRSLGDPVQDGRDAIVSDWAHHNAAFTSVAAPAASQSFQPPPTKAEPVQGSPFVAPAPKSNPAIPVQTMPAPVQEKTTAAASSPIAGTVSVTSDPDGAEIFIDSVGYGHAPTILKLSPGKHSVQLVRQGFKDWTSEFIVRENSIVNVTAKLEK